MRYLAVLLLFASAGCGGNSGPVTVACEGTLLLNGKPLEVAKREIGVGQVAIEFIPIDAAANRETYGAQADAAGKFSLPGGLPPGKYKVAVHQWDPYPTVDKLQGKFAKERTPLVREIDGKKAIDIELSKPE